jgi:hypothetical protein
MASALDRLGELVRRTEAKTRVQELNDKIREAGRPLRAAVERARACDRRVREDRPAQLRILEQAENDELHLKEHIRKIAQLKAQGLLDAEGERQAEDLIKEAQVEVANKRRQAKTELDAIARESEESRRALQSSLERYRQLRRELDRLQLPPPEMFAAEDRLAQEAERYFPAGQIRSLAQEIADAEDHFGLLDQKEQYYQLMIWVGRLRRLQASDLSSVAEDDQELLRHTFPRLVGISKQYMPGYIEAFRQDFNTDWDLYIADAEERLRQTREAIRLNRELDRQRKERELREQERLQKVREEGQTALEELKGVIARYHLPEEGFEEFLSVLKRVISGLGASEAQVLDLVRPYRDLLNGDDFRAIRRNLDRLIQEEEKDDDSDREQFREIVEVTRGLRTLMIGGSVREDRRRVLQRVFEFAELEWEDEQGNKPAMLDSLEQRIRNRSVDLVLILRSFVGHHVPGRLRPLCEEQGIPCLMVEQGYGPVQIGEALRRGLVRASGADRE